jgi:hypothetical protein
MMSKSPILFVAIAAMFALTLLPAAATPTCPLPELMKYFHECNSATYGRPEKLIALCTDLADDADTCVPVPQSSDSGETLRMSFYYLRGYGRMGEAMGQMRLDRDSAGKVLIAQARKDFTVVAASPDAKTNLRRNAKLFLHAKLLSP